MNPVILAGVAFCRGYHGLDYDDALLVAQKAFGLLEANDDEADFFEKIDLVWGASLNAGLIEPGDWTIPVDPRPVSLQLAHSRIVDHWAMTKRDDRKRPVEYDDETFVIKKKRKNKKKRRTLPDG